ncbi:MAG: pseudouridine synthase [Acidobacteria bacterium]|nr:pseudouridine synthase [Acidobacteriota bacterium]
MPLERLQKIIAAAGIASRRKAEELIQQGLVSVNGQIVLELGSKADPDKDSIRVNNKLLKGAERHEYVVLNKPRGYVTTVSDPEGRPTVMELVKSKARLYPVGRLDFNSEGLLLLTNDGALAHKLMKAASHIPKTYLVKVAGQPDESQLRRLRAGVSIAEERNPGQRVRTAPAQIRVIKEAENPWLEVTLHEGRNRQIRKMFEEVGHHVEKIRRVRYGSLELDLPPGESRSLNPREVSFLLRTTEPGRAQAQPERRIVMARSERRPARADSRRFPRDTAPVDGERAHFRERTRGPKRQRSFDDRQPQKTVRFQDRKDNVESRDGSDRSRPFSYARRSEGRDKPRNEGAPRFRRGGQDRDRSERPSGRSFSRSKFGRRRKPEN